MRIFACFFFACFFQFAGAQNLSVLEFLGYKAGEQFTRHHRVIDYFRYVANNSEKVQFIPYGKSWEGRDLALVVVSSPDNIRNIQTVRRNNLIKTGFLEGNITGRELPIVWLSYNVHGDESASTEAALMTLEALAANSHDTDKWLEEVVVIMDPCLNPDGRDRYVNFYLETGNNPPNPHKDAREHYPPWPGGRVNHYLFDLNRDWAWQTQIETRQRISIYQEWMPHVHVDFHEMGINEPYFFAPAAHPYHEVITDWQSEFQEHVGHNHARYFDENGWLYFTKEIFDLFYPSYGDTWPTYNGAIGFTYEQGGSRNAGLKVETETGDILTLGDRVDHHFTTGLSTIETAFEQRQKLLAEFEAYFEKARKDPPGEFKTYVFKSNGHEGKIGEFLKVLERNNIWFDRVPAAGGSYSGFDYQARETSTFKLEENDVIVSAYQPSSRLLKVILEPQSILEDSATYDLTAWSLPYAYDLEAYALKERINISGKTGLSFEANTLPRKPAYAYLARWEDTGDARFLSALLKEKVRVRMAKSPFRNEDQTYERGTLLITKADNKSLGEEFDKTIIRIADANQQKVISAQSGFSKKGPDMGSSSFPFIGFPEAGLIAGPGVSANAFGELWYFFEQVLEYPVTVFDIEDITSADISRYDVLVLPSGNYNKDKLPDKLLDYVKKGGKIVAFERAINAFSNDKTSLGSARKKAKDAHNKMNKKDKVDDPPRYEDRTLEYISRSAPGCIYQVHLDDSHPLAYGQDEAMYMLKRNSVVYPFMENGWNVGIFKEDSHVSGFIGSKLKPKLVNTLAFGTESIGRGDIVYFIDSPVFRGFWDSGNLILANAIFFTGN